jgi:peptide/nickel transport system substrate-binding protein
LIFYLLLLSSQSLPADGRPAYGGSIVIANDKNFQGLNPLTINIRRANNYALFDLILEGLVGTDKNDNIIPCLAESWEVSKDGTQYTFHLRRGVKFHHGRDFTSDDVKWTFNQMQDPKTRNPQRATLSILRSVEPTGPYEVALRLSRPFVPFLEKLTANYSPILPKDSLPSLASHPVGTGPFAFVSAPNASEVRLPRFQGYWQKGLPYLDEVIYQPVVEETTRMVALRSDQVQLATYLPIQSADRLIKEKDQTIKFHFQKIGLKWILLNNRRAPFNNKLVRQALAYAINKKETLDVVALGHGEVTNQRYPKGHKWWVDVPDRTQDLEKAKSLLREAGQPRGLRLDVFTHSGDLDETVIVQSQLKKAGIEMEIKLVDYVQHTQLREKGNYDLALSGGGMYLDPDGFYKSRFHSEENWDVGYNNPTVDRLLIEAQVVQDAKMRKELYRKVVEIIQEEVPVIFIGLTPVVKGVRTSLKGYEPAFSGSFNYTTGGISRAWIER